jgi:hypothetical protein
MRPNDWFSLACRVLGMWQLLDAAGYALSVFNIAAGLATAPAGYSVASYLVQTIGSFFLAVVLLAGAPIIADLFYPDSPGDEGADKKASDPNPPTI